MCRLFCSVGFAVCWCSEEENDQDNELYICCLSTIANHLTIFPTFRNSPASLNCFTSTSLSRQQTPRKSNHNLVQNKQFHKQLLEMSNEGTHDPNTFEGTFEGTFVGTFDGEKFKGMFEGRFVQVTAPL